MARASKWLKALFQPKDPADVPVTIKLAPGQTADALQVLDSSGNLVTAINSAAEGITQVATVTLTNAEIKALRASPKTLVPAPGAGTYLQFAGATLKLLAGTNVLTESAANLAVRYTNGSGVKVSQDIETTGFIDQAANTMTVGLPKIDAIGAAADLVNKALVLHNLGAGEYAGNAAADATMIVKIAYRVLSGV